MKFQLPCILLRNLKSYIPAIQISISRSVWCETHHMDFPDESSHHHLLISLFGSVIANTGLSGWSADGWMVSRWCRKDVLRKAAYQRRLLVLLGQSQLQLLYKGSYCWKRCKQTQISCSFLKLSISISNVITQISFSGSNTTIFGYSVAASFLAASINTFTSCHSWKR